jgi:hypothetical protein
MNSCFFSIDQSLNNFAVVKWEYDFSITNAVPTERWVVRTGLLSSKSKKVPSATYVEDTHERVKIIREFLDDLVLEHKPEYVAFEELAFCSKGNATRDLAGLLFCCIDTLFKAGYTREQVFKISPTVVKKFARLALPKDAQMVGSKKVKMDKNLIADAAVIRYSSILDGFKKTGIKSGLCDLADALFVGEAMIDKF